MSRATNIKRTTRSRAAHRPNGSTIRPNAYHRPAGKPALQGYTMTPGAPSPPPPALKQAPRGLRKALGAVRQIFRRGGDR